MRKTGTWLLAAALLAAAGAGATEGKEASVKGERGAAGGAMSAAPSGGSSGPSTNALDRAGDETQRAGIGGSRWEASAGAEVHRLFIQTDLEGVGAQRQFEYYFATFRYQLTPNNDKVSLRAGFYQYLLADPQETGLRADDVVLAYTHRFALPWELESNVQGSLLAPTSFISYKMGLITAPRLSVELTRKLAGLVTVSVRGFGDYYWQRYDTMADGATPNPVARLGATADVSFELPWHRPLSAGLAGYTGYAWFYLPQGQPPGPNYGAIRPQSQPVQQSYGGEAYLRYQVPKLYGIEPSLQLSYAQGDPSLGYTSRLHDGVSHLYLFYRLSSELYAALELKF